MAQSCFQCGTLITEDNDSREHVIPRAIGGRITVKGFLCKSCNTKAGLGPDAEAAQQLNALSLFFGISRQGDDPPAMKVKTVMGQELWLGPGGRLDAYKPDISKTKTPEGDAYRIKARNQTEARTILEGLKRKYPKIDVEAELATTRSQWTAPDGPVMFSLSFGAKGAHRSAIKSAAAFGHRAGFDHNLFKVAKAYLRGENKDPPLGYFHERDLVQGRPAGIPIHCVAIKANPDTKLVLGYVEYFGFQRCVICLADDYVGPLIESAYAIDPLSGTEVPVTVELPFDADDLKAIYNYELLPTEKMRAALGAVMPTGLKRQAQAERDRQISEAVDYAWANCGAQPNELLTAEHMKRISGMIAERISPYILRQILSKRSQRLVQPESSSNNT